LKILPEFLGLHLATFCTYVIVNESVFTAKRGAEHLTFSYVANPHNERLNHSGETQTVQEMNNALRKPGSAKRPHFFQGSETFLL